MTHPALITKASQSKWLNGYQVVISEVLRTYGDAKLSLPIVEHAHLVPNAR